ncbi:30S ribosomal protein S5 [Candidatus Parcubacteria bacterium]|nr:30S ribosomal protein S5 [Candidatus Parcubacteria bacterium]
MIKRDQKGKKRKFNKKKESEFDQKIVDLARVTRVMAGGKRLRFRATIVLGDKRARVGVGVAKGKDVSLAISKAVKIAEKNMINTPIINGTIPCEIKQKFGAARIFLKPAKHGTGIIAGGAVRTVLELSGLQNIVGKIYGSNNKINNVYAAIEALKKLEKLAEIKKDLLDRKNAKIKDNTKNYKNEEIVNIKNPKSKITNSK